MCTGQIARRLVMTGAIRPEAPVERYMKTAQGMVLLWFGPLVNVGTFWVVKITDMRFAILPVLGVTGIVLGGVVALGVSRLLRHTRRQTGAMFTSGSFTNMGSLGGLVSFSLLGESGYAFACMYKLFEDFVYYTVGFPVAKLYSDAGRTEDGQESVVRKLVSDPFIRRFCLSMALGILLNLSSLQRPQVVGDLNALLIPINSMILVSTSGYRMVFSAVSRYVREVLAIGLIKFAITPVTMVSIATALGIGRLYDGEVLKAVLILSSMPPAFLSLIPPQLYDLDTDLANSSWLVNTGALVVIVPVLYLIMRAM
jgi:predicted permease